MIKGCNKEGKMRWMKIGDEVIKRCPMSIVDKDLVLLVHFIINSIISGINCYSDGLLNYPAVLTDAIVIIRSEFEKYKMEKQNVG